MRLAVSLVWDPCGIILLPQGTHHMYLSRIACMYSPTLSLLYIIYLLFFMKIVIQPKYEIWLIIIL